MPSGLARNQNARRTQLAFAQQVNQGYQTLSQRGPFNGLVPDVDPNLMDGTAFTRLRNCLARAETEDHGEVLGLPDAYRQVDSTRLPLGDATPPAATGMPVVHLTSFTRVSPTGGTTPGEFTGQFIVTAIAASGGNGTANTGFLYRLAANNQWTIIAGAASMAAATRQLSAGRDGRTTSKSMPDSCVAPFGATARSVVGGAGADGQSGPIQEPCLVYTNDVDEVMVFPSSTTETLAATHTYEPLTSVAALDGGTTLGFKAKSCETWNGRVYFLNTSEAGTRRSRRLRRTAKFTADPDPAIVGAGFYDFTEFSGEGLRIETLGDVLAAYFTDGVAFVRPTGNPTSPDEPQIISTERGLLGTHAMCSIGRNVHFGIFSDGWWLLDQSGRWQEVGIRNLNDKVTPLWRQSFFSRLSNANRHRIYCYYDQPFNLVYIALPTTDEADPEEVWIWDPSSDRVFVENYPVTCFGSFSPITSAATTIDGLPGTIDDLPGTIDSYAAMVGFPKARIHGDLLGYVYSHNRTESGFDSATSPPVVQDPTWSFGLGLRSPAGVGKYTTVDRVRLEYFNHQNNANVSVTVAGPSADDPSQSASVLLNEGDFENLRVRDAWFRYTSIAPGLTVEGTGDYHIRGIEFDLWTDPLEPRSQS